MRLTVYVAVILTLLGLAAGGCVSTGTYERKSAEADLLGGVGRGRPDRSEDEERREGGDSLVPAHRVNPRLAVTPSV